MRCEIIKDILITGYIDNELDEKTRVVVDEHLKTCSECNAFLGEYTALAGKVFTSPEKTEVAQEVWTEISSRIEGADNPLVKVLKHLGGIFIPLRPVVVYCAMALIVFSAGIGFRTHIAFEKDQAAMYVKEEIDYLEHLDKGLNGFYDDIGIPFEELCL